MISTACLLLSGELCAAADDHMALAALVGMCSSGLLFSLCICVVPFAHIALVAHRLGLFGHDAAKNMRITFLSDLDGCCTGVNDLSLST